MIQFIYNLFIGPFVGMFVVGLALAKRLLSFMAVFLVMYAILGGCVYATGLLQFDWMPIVSSEQQQSLWVIEVGGQPVYLDALCVFWPLPAFIAFIGMVRAFNTDKVEYTNLRSRTLSSGNKAFLSRVFEFVFSILSK